MQETQIGSVSNLFFVCRDVPAERFYEIPSTHLEHHPLLPPSIPSFHQCQSTLKGVGLKRGFVFAPAEDSGKPD